MRDGQPVRIFKGAPDWMLPSIQKMDRSEAVGSIRRQVFERAGYECEWCGRPIILERGAPNSGEMHEVLPRGKGGEISLANSVAICKSCHRNIGHGDRRLRFGERHT